jgi:hypothetical protein
MTKRLPLIAISLIATLALTGCVTRQQADEKLARGCKAGAQTMLEDGQLIEKITATYDTPEPGLRHINITAFLKDDPENSYTYECVFEETFGPFNASHDAMLQRIQVGDKVLGKTGDNVEGDAEEFIKLDTAVNKGMGG